VLSGGHTLVYRPAFVQEGRILMATSGTQKAQELPDSTPSGATENYHYGDSYLATNLTAFDDVTDYPTITPGALQVGPDSPPVLAGFAAYMAAEYGVHRTGDLEAAGYPTAGRSGRRWSRLGV
jgi:hypothetical protein